MIKLENYIFLYALVILPLLVLLYVLAIAARRKVIRKAGTESLIKRLIPEYSSSKRNLKFLLRSLAIGCVIMALANPQIGSKMEEMKREGIDIMVVIDISNSMNAEDIKPSRIESAKRSISQLIDKLQNDRIGIVVFAGTAFTQLPLTSDYGAAKLFLSNINSGLISTQGTAIGTALNLAVKSFPKNNPNNRAIILISDGENHEDDAIAAAQSVDSAGIILHSIGMGSVEGAPIPEYYNGSTVGFKKDNSGETVVSKLDAALLEQIAAEANGKFFRASNSGDIFTNVFSELSKIQKKFFSAKVFTDYEDRFYIFIAIAVFLLFMDVLLSERKSKVWMRLNLFGEKTNSDE